MERNHVKVFLVIILALRVEVISIRVAQRKRGGPITHRSQDRNLALIIQRCKLLYVLLFLIYFFCVLFSPLPTTIVELGFCVYY